MKGVLRGGALIVAAFGAALLIGTAWAGTAASARIVTFTAKYAGTATTKVDDSVATISANGTGTGTIIRASKITGNGLGDTTQQPCVPFTGPGSMFNATGTKIAFKVLPGSTGCGDEEGNVFSISGRARVTSGTKAFRKVKGVLKFTGVYDRGQGTFSVKFKGKLTLP